MTPSVLMVCARYLPQTGGTETHVYEVSRRLATAGYAITVLTTDNTGQLPPQSHEDGVEVIRVPAYPRQRDLHLAPGLRRVIHTRHWDVMHIQGYHTLVPPLIMLAGRPAGRPYVVTFHSGGHSSGLRQAIRGAQQSLLKPLFARAKRLIAVSSYEAQSFQRQLGLPATRFQVIPNGSNLPTLPEPINPDPTRPLILSVGRLEAYKGHQRVVSAMPAVLQRLPHARLQIVGSGPYEAELRQQIAQLNLGAQVSIGAIPGGDRLAMAQLLARANVVALLSAYESQGISAWEALSLGCPLVVNRATALAEVAAQGLARSVEPDDGAEAVAEVLLAQITTPLPLPAQVHIPTWDDCAGQLAAIYNQVSAES